MAKNAGMMAQLEKRKKYDSLWEDEEKKEHEDPMEAADAEEDKGASDLKEAVITAVINKRAGGMGLISGRKAFQKPINQGVELLNAIQDVYLDKNITLA